MRTNNRKKNCTRGEEKKKKQKEYFCSSKKINLQKERKKLPIQILCLLKNY